MRAPQHIAIIMDGNRRWAKEKSLRIWEGHRKAIEGNVKRVILAAQELGVKYLTLFAWSTENWERPDEEIDFIFDIFRQVFDQQLRELLNNNIRIQIFGETDRFPADLREKFKQAETLSREKTGLVVNFCLNYGGRSELVKAVREIVASGKKAEEITEETIVAHLYGGKEIPDPDLIIRTSGEQRLSNFLLWRSAYSELLFLPTYWPDFGPEELKQAIETFQQRERRFGK